jgi:hypothetical protein
MRFREISWGSVEFHKVLWDSMRFHGIPWGSMRFYDVPVNRSVPTEANRGLTSYSLKSKNLNELQDRTIEIADQLYRMDYHIKGSSHNQESNKSQTGRMYSRRRSPLPVTDAMEGVEYTGRSGKPWRLGNFEYNWLRYKGHCFSCKRRGHVSTACSEEEEPSKKTKKTVGVARATSSGMKEKKRIRRARKEESSSEESGGIETLDEDSNSGKDWLLPKVTGKSCMRVSATWQRSGRHSRRTWAVARSR